MTLILTIADKQTGLEVSQAILAPVRAAALEQAAIENDGDPIFPIDLKAEDARRFDRFSAMLTLSRAAAGLPTDDCYGDWRRLVDTAADDIIAARKSNQE
jgi:hypothetical protein